MTAGKATQEQEAGLEETVLFSQLRDAGKELGDWLGTFCRIHGPMFDIPVDLDLDEKQWNEFVSSTEERLPPALAALLSELGANIKPLSPEDLALGKKLVQKAYELAALLRDAESSHSYRRGQWELANPDSAIRQREFERTVRRDSSDGD